MIGERLKLMREFLGLTQKDLSERLSIKAPALSRYEKSNTIPTIDIINKIVNLFEINIHWLIIGEGSMIIGEEKKNEQKTEPATSADSSDELFNIKVENAVLKKDNDRLKNENKNLIEENKDLIEERGRLRERVTIAERNNSRNNNTQKGASAG